MQPTCVPTNDPAYGCGYTASDPAGDETLTSCAALNPNAHHVIWGCANELCTITGCDAGFADCDMNPANGCETDLKAPATCGNCATPCGPSQLCATSGCASTCATPNTYCNGSCVNLQTTPDHCGSCTNACADPTHGVATCVNGMCSATCEAGHSLINGRCVEPNTDPTCCGPTCTTCSAPLGGAPFCTTGTCTGACPSGMAICSSKCVDTARDVTNCGGCGVPCGGTCSGGSCDALAKQIIATGNNVSALVADGTSVFWINNGTDIMQVARDGSSAPIQLASMRQGAASLTVDSASVYWVNQTGGGIWSATKGVPGTSFVAMATAAAVFESTRPPFFLPTRVIRLLQR